MAIITRETLGYMSPATMLDGSSSVDHVIVNLTHLQEYQATQATHILELTKSVETWMKEAFARLGECKAADTYIAKLTTLLDQGIEIVDENTKLLFECHATILTFTAACQAALDWRGFDGNGIHDPERTQLYAALGLEPPK